MKLLLVVLASLVTVNASAAVYKLVNHIQFGDKKYSNSLIIEQDKPGQLSSITKAKDGYKMKVVASPTPDGKAIHLKYDLFQIENGKDKFFGNPRIIVFPGNEASVEVGSDEQLPEYRLSVVVEQLSDKK